MTVDSFAQEMALEFGEQYADPDVAEQFLRWVQEVHTDIYQAAPWYFRNYTVNLAVTQGLAQYDLADNLTVKAMYIATASDAALVGRPVVYSPIERILSRPGTNVVSDTGTPVVWYFQTHDSAQHLLQLRFYPKPSANLTVAVATLKNPPVLAKGDQIPMPEDFFPALREGVRAKVRYNDDNGQAAEMSKAAMKEYLGRLASAFAGSMGAPSNLRTKRAKAITQAPTAQGAGA